jgi:hypothetical protein
MPTLKALRERCARTYYKALYMQQAKAVMRTPPVQPGTLPLTTLSMVHTRDVVPYLVAFKSFHRQATGQRTVVVCDPSITPADRATLRAHIPHLELRDAGEFTHPSIPRGGTWERLFAISEYATRQFTVQLDADTLATGPLPEVCDSILANRPFVIGEVLAQRIDPLAVFAATARTWTSGHVQALAEASLDGIGLPPETLYVRGCSGFTGFRTGADMRGCLLDFSERMRSKLGDRWRDWGTEQVTSNFVVANQTDARVLPFPKYASAHQTDANSVFFHFIGSVRFRNRRYERETAAFLRSLATG